MYQAGVVERLSGALVVCLVSASSHHYGDLVVVSTLGTDAKLPTVNYYNLDIAGLNCCFSTAGFITSEYHGPRRYN